MNRGQAHTMHGSPRWDEPDEARPAPTLRHRIFKWVRLTTLSGVAVSLLVHLILWLIASVVLIVTYGDGRAQRGSGEPVEFAVVSEEEFSQMQAEELQTAAPTVPEASNTEPDPTLNLLDAEALTGVTDLSVDLAAVGAAGGAGDIGKASSLVAGGAGAGTSFFGVEAQGVRFAYIVDMSGSMGQAGKWERTRDELIASIEELSEGAMFLVTLYSGDAFPLENRREWSEATDRYKKWARNSLSRVQPNGSTNPTPAFHVAINMRPRPDAIYFMTDGEFAAEVATEIETMNRELQIPIHCITFVSRGAEPLMREIARKSGGTYTHIDGGTP